jgi:anti-sigma factor RsiW
MEHCSEQHLTDFVRGVGSPAQSQDIQSHLAAGCSRCQMAHDRWSKVRRFASAEDSYMPPENLVRLVKLSFGSQPAKRRKASILATLMFDSFAQPLPAGVRSNSISAWQLLYEAEGLSVDLRFGRRGKGKMVHVVGQVFDKLAVRALQNQASIELSTEQDQVIATTSVSATGEFHLEFEQNGHLWLSVKAEGRNTVRIPITSPR